MRLDPTFPGFAAIKADVVISYIGQATKLKTLSLPIELRKVWASIAELPVVQQAADLGGVKLSFK